MVDAERCVLPQVQIDSCWLGSVDTLSYFASNKVVADPVGDAKPRIIATPGGPVRGAETDFGDSE